MKKKLFLILYVIVINITQAQTWRQVNPPPNIFNDGILSIATDTAGNLYAAGKFKNTNNEFIVAKWNGTNWAELGNPNATLKANNVITCIAIDKKGDLYAAGGFTDNTGNYYVAKWNGNSWSGLGTGASALKPNNLIYAMSLDNSGNIYVGGGFTNSGGKQYVAKWNGINWTELGGGANSLNANGLIYALASDSSGNIYTAGHFTNSSGKYYVAKWNGTNWSEVGTSTPLNANDYINCIKIDKSGNIYAGGAFTSNSGDYYIAKWNGANWSQLGNGTNGPINSIAINGSGILYAGGFGTDSSGRTNLRKWDGNNWTDAFDVGYAANDAIRSICLDNNDNVYAGGDFRNGGNHNYVAKWDGTTMKETGRQGEFLPDGNSILAVTPDIYGNVYAVGDFYNAGSVNDVAKWDGIGWVRLQSSDPSLAIGWPETITTDSLGNIYVAGRFTNASDEYFVAKWDGSNWRELKSTSQPLHAIDHITKLATDKYNNVYATGIFTGENNFVYGLAKWNDTGWQKFIGSTENYWGTLAIDTAINVYISYNDGHGQYRVAKVFQDSIAELGSGSNALNPPSFVYALTTDLKGNVYASGLYNYVSKWNGTNWNILGAPLTAQSINALITDPSGNLYATANDPNNLYVAKWDGLSWSALGGRYSLNASGVIGPLSIDIAGNIYTAGNFGHVSVYGNSALILQQPILSIAPSKYCKASGAQTIKILNFPSSPFISVSATLDNISVAINVDSTFSFNPSALSEGNHRIRISYNTGTDTMVTFEDFTVIHAVTPDVNVTTSTTTVTNADLVIITGVNASGGGTSPKFTFAKDRIISTILQSESTNNIFNLDPNILSIGENKIYVRMRTSDTCYTVQTNIDSISITKSVATGIIDIDYPNQKIFIYPNPFAESFTLKGLQTSKTYSVSIINSIGQIIYQRKISNSSDVNVTQKIPPGNYCLNLYDNSKKRLLGSALLIKN